MTDRSRLGMDAAAIRSDFGRKLVLELMKFPGIATRNDHYLALSYAIRDRILERWVDSARTFLEGHHRTVIYLSAEYLLGPQLGNALLALGIESEAREALDGLGISLDELLDHEEEPGLGNGGLGRLAACYLDSMATVGLAAIGHGIRYEFGIFDQEIRDGWQVERTDRWLRYGFPWEIRRHEVAHTVGFGGRTETERTPDGRHRMKWVPEHSVIGVASDIPVVGYGTPTTNMLRLWSAIATDDFDLDAFQVGEYRKAVEAKVHSENITKILYPNDTSAAGKTLRLQQEYFFVSCALQDCIRLLLQRVTIHGFADKYAIQLNDTHPSLAVPELMRLLVDVHGLGWDDAWRITTRTVSYTNHTLLPEALETWPLPLFQKLLPRHLEIVFEINHRFLDEVRKDPRVTEEQVKRLSIIDERGERSVRMANLATVASHTVNGVAKLHSSLLQTTILSDFAALTPERFTNVTNGVTPRRFIALANPGLRGLLDEAVGPGWLTDLERLRALEPLAEDGAFRERWRAVKRANKESLASWLRSVHNLSIDPSALLDAQCKRIHEYKRQLLNLLHVVWLGERLKEGVPEGFAPRTILLAGKAAPSYRTAKLIIRLSHGIADALASDPRTRDLLRVVFVPDFNVKNAQRIYPAADLSEQISTAGMEASGTGNMKFTLNGALTIGTLDGANVEIRDAVGADHFFLFGLTTEEVEARRLSGADPRVLLDADPELAEVIRLLTSGRFAPDVEVFRPIAQSLLEKDHFCVLADFRAYLASQQLVGRAFRDETAWCRSSILNVARAGCFSSDRSIREYAERIWKVSPVAIRGA